MTRYAPLPLPERIVQDKGLRLDTDFAVKHEDFCQAPSGEFYLLSKLFYNYGRYDADAKGTYGTFLITRLGPDLELRNQADLGELRAQMESEAQWYDYELERVHVAVTAGGEVAFSTAANRVYFLDAELRNRVGEHGHYSLEDRAAMYAGNFACQMVANPPDPRWLCVVTEPGVSLAGFSASLVAISDDSGLGPQSRPRLTCVGALKTELDYEPNCQFPYLSDGSGKPVGTGSRPTPSLVEQVKARFGVWLHGAWLHEAWPLDEDRCVVGLFHKLMRGGTRGCDFVFALVSYTGQVVGRLEGLEARDDSPYIDYHYRLAVDRAHRRIVYRNSQAMYLFSFEGEVLVRVPLGKPWKKFRLVGCTGAGEILLVNEEQHVLLRIDAVAEPQQLEDALNRAGADYKAGVAALKKAHQPTGFHWINRDHPVYYH